MEINFCQKCGKKLSLKEIGDEGLVPFCENCGVPYFNSPEPSILTAVINENEEIALLRQASVSSSNWVLVAGYVQSGESAEECAMREVKEETGLSVIKCEYLSSYFYEKRNLLMLGYITYVKKEDFAISCEVDKIQWFPLKDAEKHLREGSVGMKHLQNVKEAYFNM